MQGRIEDVVSVLDRNRVMALATNRPDGYPHCTIVGYANDGLRIFTIISPDSQKRANLERDSRISAAIGPDVPNPMAITGLSLGGRAHIVHDAVEVRRVFTLLMKRYPEYTQMPMPDAGEVALLEIRPEVVSLLDYSRGFGHADTIALAPGDWRAALKARATASDNSLPT